MDIENIKELSEKGEAEFDFDDSLDVPQGENETDRTFKIEEVKDCFNKMFAIRELISLVGSVATHEKDGGNDVDLVLTTSDMPEDLQTAIEFRLFRGFSSYFNIPYEETFKYLHLHKKESGQSPFTSWMPIYKLALIPVPEDERAIRKMSFDDVDFDKFEILEKSNRRIIAGTASTDSIDLSGEKITKEALTNIWKHIEKMPDEFLNCMLGHSSTQAGKILKSYRNRKSALLDNSIYVICELRKDLPIIDKVWEEITSDKEKFGFSIKINIPKPLKKNIKKICDEDKCWTEILDAKFIEISLTESPANTDCSDLQVLSK